uniref:Gustatory receptor n=1 Tax=Parascaris equorum TaxID=6256 RepID=A0A914R6C4_PAREQ
MNLKALDVVFKTKRVMALLRKITNRATVMFSFRYKYIDMSVNSLSLVMMIISYAVIIYKVRESGQAMAKYQLTIRTRVSLSDV